MHYMELHLLTSQVLFRGWLSLNDSFHMIQKWLLELAYPLRNFYNSKHGGKMKPFNRLKDIQLLILLLIYCGTINGVRGIIKGLRDNYNSMIKSDWFVLEHGKRLASPEQSHPSFVNVKQSNGEPYTDFITRLKQNLVRTVAQIELRDMLLPIFAYDNANSECQKVLQPLKAQGKPLEDYIKACHDIGSEPYKMPLLAQAIKGLKQ